MNDISLSKNFVGMSSQEDLPEDSILIKGESKLFTTPSSTEEKNRTTEDLRGILKDYKDEYNSVELQNKASKWRKDVSD